MQGEKCFWFLLLNWFTCETVSCSLNQQQPPVELLAFRLSAYWKIYNPLLGLPKSMSHTLFKWIRRNSSKEIVKNTVWHISHFWTWYGIVLWSRNSESPWIRSLVINFTSRLLSISNSRRTEFKKTTTKRWKLIYPYQLAQWLAELIITWRLIEAMDRGASHCAFPSGGPLRGPVVPSLVPMQARVSSLPLILSSPSSPFGTVLTPRPGS